MNDSAIIKAISKIHSIIIDLLILIFIALFSIYYTLHIGLRLDNVILPGIKIEQLYIKWDEKIVVDIGQAKFTKSNTESTFDIKSLDPKEILEWARVLDGFFSGVTVHRIQYNDTNATFRYKEDAQGYLKIDGPALKLSTTVDMNEPLLLIDIKAFQEFSNGSSMQGRLLFDTREVKLYGDLNINAGNVMPLKLYLLADQAKVRLWGRGTEPFTQSIKPAVRIAHLHPKVEPWVADYHNGKAINLEYFKGTLIYNEPISLLDTLDASLRYDEVQYTFAPGYAPVIAKYAEVTFKDRVLNIYPKEATYYGQPGEKTWLKIDFTHPDDPLLTVDVDTSAQLTQEMLPWLKGYGITLPFYQTKGITTVKLAIGVYLNNIRVNADGTFKTDEATFNFSDTDIDVKNVLVKLNNSDVDIQRLNASLLDNAVNADLAGKINPVEGKGKFNITLHKLRFQKGDNLFEMDPKHKLLDFTYLIQPKKERLKIPKSYWRLNNHPVTLNQITAPFEFSSLSGHIPTTLLSSEDQFKSYVTGEFNIKKLSTDLIVDLLTLKTPSLTLEQTNVPLDVKYNDGLFLNLKKQSDWKAGKTRFTLFPSIVSYKNSLLYIQEAHLRLADVLDTHINGAFSTSENSGAFTLGALQAKTGDSVLFKAQRDIKVIVNKADNSYVARIPSLDLVYRQNETGWDFTIDDINAVAEQSPFMRDYNLTKGNVHFRSPSSSDVIELNGSISYPYAFLVKDNTPIETVSFNGSYQNEKLAVTLNDRLEASLKNERLNIRSKGIGFNFFALYDYLKDHPSAADANGTKSRFKANIEAADSYLYLNEGRSAPADKLLLQYESGSLNAQLLHGKNGGVSLEYTDKNIFLYGDGLNDIFMNGLAEFSDFKGGNLSFYVLGTLDELEGVIQIKDTIVKDYKVINNVFAFINTIPALVTFSVPHYSTNGLHVHDAYGGFTVKDKLMTIKGFHINAEELAFNGKGTVDLNTKTLDIETSLVTDATTNLLKIPLLGYILVGKENKATTTITLTGPIENPKVENTLAKDIGIVPFNILKRALTFPVHYLEKAQDALEEQAKEKQ